MSLGKNSILVIVSILSIGENIQARYKYQLAICAIFQNEAPYLKEWIEFHKLLGVQHFILYNNFSTDNYHAVLEPYIKKAEVEIIDWNVHATPSNGSWVLSAYNDSLQRFSSKIKWIAYLDLDEFLFPVRDRNLLVFLKKYDNFGGVCANWVMYGTSNVQKIEAGKLLIESLDMRSELDYSANYHVKSIVRPDRVSSFSLTHYANYIPPYFQVNSKRERFNGPFSPYVCIDDIRINHYWTRDENFFFNVKVPRRQQDMGESIENSIKLKNELNKVSDTSIFKFLPKLKRKMVNNEN